MFEAILRSLEEAEGTTRDLIDAALGEGDYALTRRLVEYAAAIRSLGASIASSDRPSPGGVAARQAEAEGEVSSCGNVSLPAYFIEGTRLVKIGRSRQRGGRPYYRHETPARVFDDIAEQLRNLLARSGQPWSMKDLEGLLVNRRVPVYHVYNVVGALREAGLVEPVGRGQYRFAPGVPPEDWWEYLADQLTTVLIVEGEVMRFESQ